MFTEDQKRYLQSLQMVEQNEATVLDAWDKIPKETLFSDLTKIYESFQNAETSYFLEIFALAERTMIEYAEKRIREDRENEVDDLDLDEYDLDEDMFDDFLE